MLNPCKLLLPDSLRNKIMAAIALYTMPELQYANQNIILIDILFTIMDYDLMTVFSKHYR